MTDSFHKYHIRKESVSAPCAADCPSRCPGCGAMCATWQLYTSIRDYIYHAKLYEGQKLRMNDKTDRAIMRACNKRSPRWREQKWR